MALISELELSTKDRQSIHRRTRCQYTIVKGSQGERYLQLDTYGSENREIPDKVSQSIQFDRHAATQLIEILHETFPDLDARDEEKRSIEEESDDDDEEESFEGRVLLRLHRLRERDPRVVRQKKEETLKAKGCLQCEVCDFDFASVYGPIGEGFAECHHRVPLKELDGTEPTRIGDLAIVCANCHRMLHRRPHHSVEELRALLVDRKYVAHSQEQPL